MDVVSLVAGHAILSTVDRTPERHVRRVRVVKIPLHLAHGQALGPVSWVYRLDA
jgi:hypothetical protein